MKKTSTLLFLVLSMNIVSAQDTLTQAQMREDFNYMMEQYEHIHPNPTWSLGEESYSELKRQTLAQLDHPMTQLDFWRMWTYRTTAEATTLSASASFAISTAFPTPWRP